MLVGCGQQPGDTTRGAAIFGPLSVCTKPHPLSHDQDCLLALVGTSEGSWLWEQPLKAQPQAFSLSCFFWGLTTISISLLPRVMVLQTQGDESLPPNWS